MSELKPIANGLDPDDLWRNVFWLRGRIEALELAERTLTKRIENLLADLQHTKEDLWELEADLDRE